MKVIFTLWKSGNAKQIAQTVRNFDDTRYMGDVIRFTGEKKFLVGAKRIIGILDWGKITKDQVILHYLVKE